MLNFKKKLPERVEIEIPSIRDDMDGFYKLWAELFNKNWANTSYYYIVLTFSACNFAGVNMTAILGAFVHFVQLKLFGSTIRIETRTMNKQVYQKLVNMGLLEALDKLDGHGFIPKTDEIIRYKEFPISTKEEEILFYLRHDWLGKNRLNFSDDVESAVLSSLWEIYANAFEHSETPRVQSCGSYDKKNNKLTLLVGDLGKGIVNSVVQYLNKTLSPREALEWALIKGNSTYTANLKESGEAQPRGLGLHLLTQLVDINEGRMEIYTGSIFYVRNLKKSFYQTMPIPVSGCWVRLTLNCIRDVKYYFSDENIPEYF